MTPTVVQRSVAGFPGLVLGNDQVEAVFIPELGGRMVSCRAHGGREWLFHPGDDLRLWPNRPGDRFTASTHAGLDECLPTISACHVAGRDLPDHGSCWAVPWMVLPGATDEVALGLDLPGLPLRLERRVTLAGTTLRFAYRLTNHGPVDESWGWAFHGLLALHAGDRIELPGVQAVQVVCQHVAPSLPGAQWAWPSPRAGLHLDRADLGGEGTFAKVMAGPLAAGAAALQGDDGQRLEFRWDAQALPWCGLWLTRGGYCGQHGIAIEPSNLPGDSLEKEIEDAAVLAAGGVATWSVELTIGRR
jgi:galactose mutarotase-like enzyme